MVPCAGISRREYHAGGKSTASLSDEEYKELFDKALAEALAYNGPPGIHSSERNSARICSTL